jgi:GrpB-like predicted nucleotidyltransferase (UPF0157 family)
MTAHVVVRSVDEAPATLSRAVLRDLLRGELRFEGMAITDAVEMRAISATMGAGEAAVRAVLAGADAICLGHDLGDEAVEEVIGALVASVPEERLAEAAGRVRMVAVDSASGAADRSVGLAAAQRALLVEGDAALTRPALVVELVSEPTQAAGEVPASLGARLDGAETVALREAPAELPASHRQLVLVLRDAHRHAWQRETAGALLSRAPDAIVVETGVPLWRPEGGAAYIATFGAGRVNLEAAAGHLQLRSFTIGELQPLDGPIELADYDPAWAALFRREEERIRRVLGDRALQVEHVGSTSVPGLAAKSIIDVVLVVFDSADEPAYVGPLEEAGYVLRIREPDWFEHRVLKGPDTNVNVHVFSAGCPEIERMLAFRDRLRASDADRERYERAKRRLAERPWRHVQHYADAKSEIVEEILERAPER